MAALWPLNTPKLLMSGVQPLLLAFPLLVVPHVDPDTQLDNPEQNLAPLLPTFPCR